MNSSKKDYSKLYHFQDKFPLWWASLELPFYLTGGTALGRFYLNHRYSDDLDFFLNADPRYSEYITELQKSISSHFNVNRIQSLFSDDFTRLFINDGDQALKVEFINDVDYHVGLPLKYQFGLIDTPVNILSNKITALVGRDEPKDIFDIIHLSQKYAFSWVDIFEHAKRKAAINELDVEERLFSFPIEWLNNVNRLKGSLDKDLHGTILKQIADDFMLGKENSLGIDKTPIEMAKPDL